MERSGIIKLNNENYDAWKLEVEFLLVREGLWKFVEPGVKPAAAADGSNAAALVAWEEGDQKARATIGLLLSRSQHGLIRNTKTAKEVWSNLKRQHEKKSLTSKVHLLKRICDLKFNEGDDIVEHLIEFEDLFEKLSNAGTKLDNDLQVVLVFRSLPSSFDALTTTLENRSDEELTLAFVKDKIINEVQKRKEIVPADSSVLKVNGKLKTIVCHHCQKAGHKKRDCKLLAKQDKDLDARSHKFGSHESKRTFKNPPKARVAASEKEAFVFSAREGPTDHWIVDSGASSHMCANLEYFEEVQEPNAGTPGFVTVADGEKAMVKGVGSCQLDCYGQDGVAKKITLTQVLYVPDLDMNLVSVGQLVAKGARVIFDQSGCTIAREDRVAAVAVRRNGLYHLRMVERSNAMKAECCEKECVHDWHKKLGHRDVQAIQDLQHRQLATGIKIRNCGTKITCETCLAGKFSRLPFPKKAMKKSVAVMDLVHTDLCGPMRTATPGGRRYFLTLIDDHSRYTVLYLLREKSETAGAIEDYVLKMRTLFGRPPKKLRSDQGGEYRSGELIKFLKREGIQQEFTTAYTPQQNGIAERKNRSLVEMARCLLLEAAMHNRYWGEAINTANFLQNILPTKSAERTPFENWHGFKPDMRMLQVFGSEAYVFVPDARRTKLDAKAEKLIFVGYSQQHKAWRFINTKSNQITISRDARFLNTYQTTEESPGEVEDDQYFQLPPVKQDSEQAELLTNDANPEDLDENLDESFYEDAGVLEDHEIQEEQVRMEHENICETPRRSCRSTKGVAPDRYNAVGNAVQHELKEPSSYKEAMTGPCKELWKEAIEDELQSLHQNHVWDFEALPAGKKTIGCRWIFKRKTDEQGQVVRYKARLVAQGYTQKFGEDYDEVFAPVVKQITYRTLFSVASQKKMLIKHADVKTAYLNGELQETVYMRLPPGVAAEGENMVCRLRKGLYGLKQAARIWNHKLDDTLKKMGFYPSVNDSCLYVKRSCDGKVSYIAVYVDDFVIVCNTEEEYDAIIKDLNRHFKVTSLGDIKHFLGIQVNRTEEHISLNQATYIRKMLTRFGLEDAKPSKIPLDPGHLQTKEEKALPNNRQYASLIRGLLYVATNTRPDIAAAVSILGRKVSCPTNSDWTEAKRVLRYLKGSIGHELILGVDATPLEIFVDADWAGDSHDRKSTTGYLFRYAGGMVGWCSRKQDCVTLSSSEAEYVALAESCKELKWILRLFQDLGVRMSLPVIINEDNQSTIKLLDANSSGRRSKHVDTRYHFVCQMKQEEVIKPQYLSTNDMIADMMTKPLQRVKQTRFREAARILPSRRSDGGANQEGDGEHP